MAANFWVSTQAKWLMPKERVLASQAEDRQRGLSEEQLQQLKGHFTQYIFDLANSTKLRQRVSATAVVYFRRFYTLSSFSAHDPRLVAPGCLYLASKAEEMVVAAKSLVGHMKRLRPTWPAFDHKHLLDMEMVILEVLDAQLVVFSPYHSLTRMLASDSQLAELGQNAWAALNDAYRTDVVLLYPPHVVAIGCLFLASVRCSRDLRLWLEGLNVDLDGVYDVAMSMMELYEHRRVPLGIDEVNRLLEAVLPPKAP